MSLFLIRNKLFLNNLVVFLQYATDLKTWSQVSRHLFYDYSVFHRLRQAKFENSGSILSSSQILLLPQPPQKMKLASKVVQIDSKNRLANNDLNP